MSARKLQTEIDKTLKKVGEGVEQFEEQYKKIQASGHSAHKDKLEAELKTQIKKLQRLRDQIKTWLQSNEIKDKKALTDARKLIEVQMERFKACEKEMKTKAFSKEGLNARDRMDPKEQLKTETGGWISNQVDELSRQVEMTEAEVEQLTGGARKGKKGGSSSERAADLEHAIERRKWHISRLELMNRLMENGNLEPERIVELREDIAYFVESNTEEDFEEDEGIYDDLNLDEEEEAFGLVQDDQQSSHDSMSIADASDLPPAPSRTPVKKATKEKDDAALAMSSAAAIADASGEKSPTVSKKAPRKATLDGSVPRPTGLSAPSRSSSGAAASSTSSSAKEPIPPVPALPAASAPTPSRPALPPIRYSAAAASAVANSNNPPTPSTANAAASSNTPSQQQQQQQQQVAATSATSAAALASPSPAPATLSAQAQRTAMVASPTSMTTPTGQSQSEAQQAAGASSTSKLAPSAQSAAQTGSAASSASPVPSRTSAASVPPSSAPSEVAPSPAPSHASVAQQSSQAARSSPSPAGEPTTPRMSPSQQAASIAPLQALDVSSSAQQQQQQQIPGTTPSLQQPSIPALQQQQQQPMSPGAQQPVGQQPQQQQQEPRLPSSLADLVTSFESAKQKSLRRDNNLGAIQDILEAGYPNMPQPADAEKPKYYIPRNPFSTPHYYPQQPSPHLANPSLFAKFDVDTLFYIFYYCQGTYMQHLAAQELKKQSWRFHKQYLTWFQRANEPQAITDEYEQGVYLYFDFEGSWAQRRKENFSFLYRHLEE